MQGFENIDLNGTNQRIVLYFAGKFMLILNGSVTY